MHQNRITVIYIKIFTTAISMAKKKNLCLPKRPVTSLQRGMRTGRPVALQTTYLTGRDDTLPHNDISTATSSSSRWTPALTAKVDDHPEKSTKTTVYERLDPKGAILWVVNLIFTTTETHDNAHAPITSI